MPSSKFLQLRFLKPPKRTTSLSLTLSVIIFLLVLSFLINLPVAQAHAGFERSNPPDNARLPAGQVPSQIQVWFAEVLEPRFSELRVVDSSGKRVDAGDSRISPDDSKSMVVGMQPGLPDGPYSVIFSNASAEDGHIQRGSYSFIVGAGNLPAGLSLNSPLDLVQQGLNSRNENANFWSISLRWLNYLSGAMLLGALLFGTVVWQTVTRKLKAAKIPLPEIEKISATGFERIRLLAKLGLAGWLAGWLGWLFYQAATLTSQTPWQLLGWGVDRSANGPYALFELLLGSRYGLILLVRLVLLLAIAFILLVATRQSVRPGPSFSRQISTTRRAWNFWSAKPNAERPARPAKSGGVALFPVKGPSNDIEPSEAVPFEKRRKLWWAGAVLSAGVMLTTSLNSHAASTGGLTWRAIGFDWLHLISTGMWVGGLLALALVLAAVWPDLVPGSGNRTRLLAALIPAFSKLAIVCVMVLLFSGIFNTMQHLSGPEELVTTSYGLSLLIKIALMALLLLLAAYNRLAVQLRMLAFARSKKTGPQQGPGSLEAGRLGRRFRLSVLAECGLVVVVLLAAAFLTSNPPPRSVSATAKALYYQLEQSDIKVELAISPGRPGDNTFEARITDKNTGQIIPSVRLVDLRFTKPGSEAGNSRLELKSEEARPGRYLGQSALLNVSGDWQLNLLVQRNGQDDLSIPARIKLR